MSIITWALIMPPRHPSAGDSWARDGVSHQGSPQRRQQHLRVLAREHQAGAAPRVQPFLHAALPLSWSSSGTFPVSSINTPTQGWAATGLEATLPHRLCQKGLQHRMNQLDYAHLEQVCQKNSDLISSPPTLISLWGAKWALGAIQCH